MTEPRKCPKPGCGRQMIEYYERSHSGWVAVEPSWVCPATPEQHEIAALRARVAEQQSQLDTVMKKVVMLREAVKALLDQPETPESYNRMMEVGESALSSTTSADQWLAAHDRAVLEGAWERVRHQYTVVGSCDLRSVILGTDEKEK